MATKPQTSRAMASVGRRLKTLRLDVRPRLTQGAVGAKIGKSQDLISLMEKGGQLPTDQQLRVMLDLYGVDQPTRLDLLAEIREARATEHVWWTEYLAHLPRSLVRLIEIEDTASKIAVATGGLIPWPFQTAAYMAALDDQSVRENGAEKMSGQHAVRQRRQDIVTRSDRPVIVNAVFSEAAIRAQVGGALAMKKQLHRVIEMAEQANVSVRIIPFVAGAAAASQTNLTIMDFPAPNDPGVASMDTGTGVSILEDPKEVRARRRRFDYLVGQALSPAASVELIRTVIKEQ